MSSFDDGFNTELKKIAAKEDPTFFEKHPVLTGFGPSIVGAPFDVAGRLLGEKAPRARGALGVAGGLASLLSHWGPIASEQERLSQYLTEQEMARSPYWTVRHPIWAGLLLPGAPGWHASAARKELEEKGILDALGGGRRVKELES